MMNAIIVIEALNPAVVFATGGVDDILSKLRAEVLAEKTDISTEKGRKAIAALAYKVARSKTALDDMGKALTADLKAKSGAIDAERKRIRDELDSLKDHVRKPLTDFENAEKERIAAHEADLSAIDQQVSKIVGLTSAEIRIILDEFLLLPRKDRQEFHHRFLEAESAALRAFEKAIVDAEASEARSAELERLRTAEQERLAAVAKAEAEREIKEREERTAAKAKADAEAAAADLIAKAEAATEAAKLACQNAERAAKEAVERAARDKELAVQAERQRAEDEAERRRDESEARIRAESAERTRIVEAEKANEAAIAAEKAKREADVNHQRKVNLLAVSAFIEIGLSEVLAYDVVKAIAKEKIPNVYLNYGGQLS